MKKQKLYLFLMAYTKNKNLKNVTQRIAKFSILLIQIYGFGRVMANKQLFKGALINISI